MAFISACVLLLLVALSGVEGVCMDKLDNCNQYSKTDCINYAQWAKTSCAKYCGICSGSDNCPSGWGYSRSDNTCFRTFGMTKEAERKTWYEARDYCQEQSGSLVIIKSEAKNSFIQAILQNTVYYWQGIKNVDKTGKMTFKYVDGSILTYKNWKYDQPDNYQNKEHCVVMLSSGKWSDISCLSKQGFICQRNP